MLFFYSHTKAIDTTLSQISRTYRHLKTLCDVGCGNGHRTMLFKNYKRSVSGIDRLDFRLAENKKFKFIHKDLFKNDFSSRSFDMVFSYDVIEHLENPDAFFKEIRRLLKPNGILVLSTPNKYRILGAILILLGKRRFPYCLDANHYNDYPDYWHITEYSNKEMKNILEKNGFTILKHHKIFYGITGSRGFRTFFNLPFFHNHIVEAKKIE